MKKHALLLSLPFLALGCAPGNPNGDGGVVDDGGTPGDVPSSYVFTSRFSDESSVSYGGQAQRQLHLEALKSFIGGLEEQSYLGETADVVVADLNYFFDYKNSGGTGADAIGVTPNGASWKQSTFGDLGSPASLREKMPDQDLSSTDGVVGVGDGSLLPTEVVDAWFAELADLVIARGNGSVPTAPDGTDIPDPYVTDDGRNLRELLQKYIGGAVSFSQGAADYLGDGPAGKGLLSDNVEQVEGKPYTQLEHHWDEGFGYFGAPRDYGDYTDDEIAAAGGRNEYKNGYHDTDGDGVIDAASEYVFGHSANAAKRDRGSAESAPTDFTADAFEGFLAGRHLITSAGGALSEAQLTELKGYRDQAIGAWEKAIAASVVHYINDVLGDMGNFGMVCDGSDDDRCYSYSDHAKHWSEMKGFALSLQFNPRSPLSSGDLAALHALLGDKPVLETAQAPEVIAYKEALVEARSLIGDAYGFDAANLGDEDGNNGW